MKKVLFAALIGLAMQASTANAADIVEEAMYDWTGFYAGLNAGYAFGGDDAVGVLPTYGNVGDLEIEGMFGGIQAGYNFQADSFVMGVEGDIQLSGISDEDDNGRVNSQNDNTYFGTLRLRAGYAWDRTLIYATGGLAYGGFDYSVDTPTANIDDDFARAGYAVGGGVEYAFDNSWTMKLEYLYANFGSEDLEDAGETTVATPDFHSVRLGVNFRF